VVLGHIDALYNHFVDRREHTQHLGLLALVFAGDDEYSLSFFDVHGSDPAVRLRVPRNRTSLVDIYTISGARDAIF